MNALKPILHYVCSEMRRSAESGIGLWSFRPCELCKGFDQMLIMIYSSKLLHFNALALLVPVQRLVFSFLLSIERPTGTNHRNIFFMAMALEIHLDLSG